MKRKMIEGETRDVTQVYLSLGGNQAKTWTLLEQAIEKLARVPDVQDLRVSSFYQTSPVGNENQAFFINAACTFQTTLMPKALLQQTQRIEKELGKIPKPKWASRPIDIDILFHGEMAYVDEELQIPHPCWQERLFVLIPLADLTPCVHVKRGELRESYLLKELIDPLLSHSQQMVSLLEKNDKVG
ncbi:2-amino-4-hydroxy-6-hydroxymethyldihydropteridine diphosphokinase [Candidatus Protochlamydia phocaeensis]|uniref:2-amino-4-hydroxy-6- hydroxymethyldihydropteridine diphosphokinase n=1 Tax=Candidatus Protochlamydia phocaeensis TaxID=1414722 RepID=UPI0008385081|nr:2-amino-4-hydroxy-6-hydroxymethyldihydropteridine diphosphokinase [Candidatus Protochlamydia phocaeensis]